MSDIPQTDVSRPSALPTARLQRAAGVQPTIEQNSGEYLDAVEEEWNKKVDAEVETLVDGILSQAESALLQEQDQMQADERARAAPSSEEPNVPENGMVRYSISAITL